MITKILVPVDGSRHADKAIEFALNIARQENAAIHLLHVVEETKIPKGIMDYAKLEKINESPDTVYLEFVGQKILSKAEELLKDRGIENITGSVRGGDPAKAIIDYASYHDMDIIVIGSHGSGGGVSHLGSVAMKVANLADRTCVIERKKLLDDKRILIVDDEPDVLETLEELLSMCYITKASSAEKAKELLETQKYDMAILDIMGVDGYRLLELANQRKVIAVMLTAHALNPEHAVRSYKQGAASYIPKDKMTDISVFLNDILV
ncbi:MAG: universal stress protein, partial [Deltaproteobacteria bacterium]|nr:universal stress protein [Deltaproteobacteria bacterium]